MLSVIVGVVEAFATAAVNHEGTVGVLTVVTVPLPDPQATPVDEITPDVLVRQPVARPLSVTVPVSVGDTEGALALSCVWIELVASK
jgi:hypothetical protein